MAEPVQDGARTLLAHTLYSTTTSDGQLGFVRPVAEFVEDQLVPLDESNFCQTMKVFVTNQYDELEQKYPNRELFKLTVYVNQKLNENVEPAFRCKYVSTFKWAEALKPKDAFEVVEAELPDANQRAVAISGALPGTRYIFIRSKNSLFGPFRWSTKEDLADSLLISFVDAPLPGVKLATAQVYELALGDADGPVIKANDGNQYRYFLTSLSALAGASFLDYSSDEDIIRFAAKVAADYNVKVIEKSKFDSLISILQKNPKLNVPLAKQRLQRLSQIVLDAATAQSEVIQNISDYLKSEHGRPLLAAYVEKNQAQFLESIKKDKEEELNQQLESKQAEIRNAESRLKVLKDSNIELAAQAEELKRATKQELVLDAARAEADVKLQQRRAELVDVEKAIADKLPLVDGLASLERIQSRVREAEAELKSAIKREIDQKRVVEELGRELNKSDEDLRGKLTTLKPFVDAINGTFESSNSAQLELSVQVHELAPNDSLVMRQRDIVRETMRRLGERGRRMHDWEVANLLISTQQSFLTFFAGMPGVGKTSLARLLPIVQGLTQSRLQEVPVARGWTSQKELVGFYNPLSSRFQPAATGMYDYLRALAAEPASKPRAMAYILLDEANLSPIEHYWSAFMGMTDGGGDRILKLGQNDINITDSLRFIATINYDGTTEPLSPRIVDRCPIIIIGANIDDEPASMTDIESSHPLPISSFHMQELFGLEAVAPDLEDTEKMTFDRIRRTLMDNDSSLGRPISISARKSNAVRQYCNKARGIMNAENDFLALDIAVLQHILPLVRGSGNRFAKRMSNLQRDLVASGLPKSAAFVQTMILNGEHDLHTYDFFCW